MLALLLVLLAILLRDRLHGHLLWIVAVDVSSSG